MISATMVDANVWEVVVEKPVETVHRVSLTPEFHRRLCGGGMTQEWVIIQAFRFLLEREANTSILAEFDLEEIGRYFPEFETDMARRLSQPTGCPSRPADSADRLGWSATTGSSE